MKPNYVYFDSLKPTGKPLPTFYLITEEINIV